MTNVKSSTDELFSRFVRHRVILIQVTSRNKPDTPNPIRTTIHARVNRKETIQIAIFNPDNDPNRARSFTMTISHRISRCKLFRILDGLRVNCSTSHTISSRSIYFHVITTSPFHALQCHTNKESNTPIPGPENL